MPSTFRPTALVVETNYLIASVIEFPLTHHGYRVLMAANAEEALALLNAYPVQVALIDFRLQHGAPEGLVAKLMARGVPFIFCTAASADEVNERFPGALVMQKPFSDDQLLATLATVSRPGVFPLAQGA